MHLATQIQEVSRILPVQTTHLRFQDPDYLALICHEIRNPLNSIVGLANILSSLQCSPDKQKECADMLRDSSKMLVELLNDLLDSFKLENSKVELEHILFDLSTTLEEAKNIIAIKAQEKGLEVHVGIGKGCPTLYMGDPLRIRQILLNLLGNAVKFTDKGTISLYMTERETLNGHSEVCITVADSGIGIEKEKLGKIFDKYAQGCPSVSRKYGGTGLGLFITQELTRLMKGSITVKSWPLMGSHFIVTLPLQKATELQAIA